MDIIYHETIHYLDPGTGIHNSSLSAQHLSCLL